MQEVPQRPRAEIEVPPAGGLTVTPELANREVEFAHVTIAGATAFGAPDFAPVLAPILNRRVALRRGGGGAEPHRRALREGRLRLLQPRPAAAGSRRPRAQGRRVEGSVSGVEVQDGIKSQAVRERIAALLGKLRGRKPLKRSSSSGSSCSRPTRRASRCMPAPSPIRRARRTRSCWWSAARSSASSRWRRSTASRPCPTPA